MWRVSGEKGVTGGEMVVVVGMAAIVIGIAVAIVTAMTADVVLLPTTEDMEGGIRLRAIVTTTVEDDRVVLVRGLLPGTGVAVPGVTTTTMIVEVEEGMTGDLWMIVIGVATTAVAAIVIATGAVRTDTVDAGGVRTFAEGIRIAIIVVGIGIAGTVDIVIRGTCLLEEPVKYGSMGNLGTIVPVIRKGL